jgi:hypothetical protein
MRKAVVLVLVLAGAVMFVASCQKQDIEKDKAAVRALVEGDTTHFKGGTSGDSTENTLPADDTTMGFWWRGPQTHDSAAVINVEVEGDSAWVSWHQHNYGEIFHWVKLTSDTAVKWTKPLQEAVQLNAVYKREGKDTDTDRGWKLKKLSLAYGQSETTKTVRIDSMRIYSSLREILIAGPLETYFPIDSLVTFTPGEKLDITLYTNATDAYAWLHALLFRLPFDNQGDGVHAGTWNAPLIPGPWVRFAIFDFMTKSTLMDPDAPYDFDGWLLLYKVQTAD